MPVEMQGRRVTLPEGADPYSVLKEAGDYCGPDGRSTNGIPAVWFLLPTATPTDPHWGGAPQDGLHHVQSPPHVFKEEPDGTLTIRESIGAGPSGAYYWHGYLNQGRWELTKKDR